MDSRPTPKTLIQMLVLAAVSLAAAAMVRPFYETPLDIRYPWSEHVERSAREKGIIIAGIEEARQMVESFSHIVLDARQEADYLAGHIPGSLSLPAEHFDRYFPGVAMLLSAEQPILVYCSGQDCDESLQLSETLMAAGYTNIHLFVGGMKAWEDAGQPVGR